MANQERRSSLAVWVTYVVLMSASTMHGNDLLKENNDSRKAWRCSMSDRLYCWLMVRQRHPHHPPMEECDLMRDDLVTLLDDSTRPEQ